MANVKLVLPTLGLLGIREAVSPLRVPSYKDLPTDNALIANHTLEHREMDSIAVKTCADKVKYF